MPSTASHSWCYRPGACQRCYTEIIFLAKNAFYCPVLFSRAFKCLNWQTAYEVYFDKVLHLV
ncbi:hypothetical protein yaldo0001_23370 [Yersinia aldovae ATCC 35236]|nr:hypothetical protein yaldo0001_23370 [Yersinia aldovae ATCC 35236]